MLAEQPFSDVLLHVNVAAYYGYGTGGVGQLLETLELLSGAAPGWPARVALVTRNVEVAPPDAADALRDAGIATGIPLYRTFDEAATAIAAGKRHARGDVASSAGLERERARRMSPVILSPVAPPPGLTESPTYDLGRPIAGVHVGLAHRLLVAVVHGGRRGVGARCSGPTARSRTCCGPANASAPTVNGPAATSTTGRAWSSAASSASGN